MKISEKLRLLVRPLILGCSFLLSMLFVSCTSMIGGSDVYMQQGKVTSLKDGREIDFKLENPSAPSSSPCRMSGYDSSKGELLLGRYSKQSKASTGVVTDIFGLYAGSVITGGNSYAVQGVLKGNKGTIMFVNVDMIGSNTRDHGIGRASDNKGNNYHVTVSPVLVRVTDFPASGY